MSEKPTNSGTGLRRREGGATHLDKSGSASALISSTVSVIDPLLGLLQSSLLYLFHYYFFFVWNHANPKRYERAKRPGTTDELSTSKTLHLFDVTTWNKAMRAKRVIFWTAFSAAQSCDSVWKSDLPVDDIIINVGFVPVYTPRRMNCSFPMQRHRLVTACQDQTLSTFQKAWLTKLKTDDINQTKVRRKGVVAPSGGGLRYKP